MITFLENFEYSRFQVWFASRYQIQPLQILTSVIPLPVQKIQLSSWPELSDQINLNNADLFDFEVSDSNFLIDFGNLEISPKVIETLKTIESLSGQYFFYSNSQETLKAETKAFVKKNKLEITSLKKIDESLALSIASEYNLQAQTNLKSTSLSRLIQKIETYQEIVDKIDFLSLSGDSEKFLEQVLIVPKQEIFMMAFDLNNPAKNQSWLNIEESEIQLAVSIVFGKLIKSNTTLAKKALADLIQTDYNIKTVTKVNSLTFWKLFIWNTNNYAT